VHTARILAVGGAVAVDSIIVGAPATAPTVPVVEITPVDPAAPPVVDPAAPVMVTPVVAAPPPAVVVTPVVVEPPPAAPPVVEPTPAPVIVEPTPLPVLMLPASATMDDGALDWKPSGNWALTSDPADVNAGLFWQATAATGDPSGVAWQARFDLTLAQRPVLTFQSRLNSAGSPAGVAVSVDGVNWMGVSMVAPSSAWTPVEVDLSAYRGQIIQVLFVWMPTAGSPDVWHVDNVLIADVPLPDVGQASIITATAPPPQ
jgi:hypothetical protein